MRAAVLVDTGKLEIRDAPMPQLEPYQVLVRTTGVGICGTDLHIYGGSANYNRDAGGRPISLRVQPQILGHEVSGVIEDVGSEVRDLEPGDRVAIDQGLNCVSQRITPVCEYCETGDSHQCLNYKEHGITGLPGGFAEYLAIAAVNAVRVEGEVPRAELAFVEPLACVLHSLEFAERAAVRYALKGPRLARHVMILGAGPAGILFLQCLRNVYRFDGAVLVADINARKLALAESFGATVLQCTGEELVEETLQRTHGEKTYYLVEATGTGAVFHFLPGLLRKQATVVLYGHGHEGADMTLLNYLQFLEPSLVSSVGASGGFDTDRRPLIYRTAMRHLVSGRVRVGPLITHPCDFHTLPGIFAREYASPDFMKAVLLPN